MACKHKQCMIVFNNTTTNQMITTVHTQNEHTIAPSQVYTCMHEIETATTVHV